MNNVFVTYNKNSEIGENTALRLQTLSSLYGFNVNLPYRINETVNSETKNRIDKASFVLCFSPDNFLSKNLIAELSYADKINKPIVIAFDKNYLQPKIPVSGKNVKFFSVNFYDIDSSINQIASFLEEALKNGKVKNNTQNSNDGLAKVLVTLGIGLLAAWALSSKEN